MYRLFLFLLAASLFAVAQHEAAAEESRLLISESFDDCAFSPGWNGSYVRSECYPGGTSPFVAMDDHDCVLQQRIPAGTDDMTPAQVGMEGTGAFQRVTGSPEVSEFYITWEEYYPAEHDFADGAQKMLRFTSEGGPGMMLQNQYNNRNLQISAFHPSGVDIFQNSGRSVPVDRWVSFAVWCKLNTPGRQDGFCRAWMDNEQIIDMSNVNMRGNDTRGWYLMWVGGNHTNQKPTTRTSLRFIDNIRWYNTKPASGPVPTATPKPTATATPKPTATATPKPTATATPKPTATATPKPTATPTVKPTPVHKPPTTPTVKPTPVHKPRSTATPKPTPIHKR